jgi:protoporphyrinogen oxidase
LKKIVIIGAGVSGLSIGQLLKDSFECDILEAKNHVGGIARTKNVDGIPYHTVGGHCFNSKNKKVMEFVFEKILPKEEWNLVERYADIFFENNYIPYPIEFSVKEIYKFDKELAFKITNDFLNAEIVSPKNLEEWFIQNFGYTLAEKYFLPYNKKIWQMDPSKMSYTWVEGKLPLPDKKSFFNALLSNEKDTMPHAKFHYPKTNNQNTFIDALAQGLNIRKEYKVWNIEYKNEKWIINDEIECDVLISTMPLDKLPFVIKGTPKKILKETELLKYNKVTNVLWKVEDDVQATWSYFPEENTIFHRHIHIGNFLNPKQPYTITESMGEHSLDEMVAFGKKLPHLKEPIDYNVSDYAYPVFDENYAKATKTIKDYLRDIDLFTLGRFGEWEYYNMDICIEKAMELSKHIKQKNKGKK